MTLEEGINKIFDGNCMLFLGSGFSLGSLISIGKIYLLQEC